MKISCNRLKKYIKNSDQIDWISLWETFTIRIAEVEGLEIKGQNNQGIVVGEIIECNNHPTKDKYHLLKVNNGEKVVKILCGAPNVRAGLKVALVNVGGMVSGFTITEKEIAGFESEGMLLSTDELGIGNDHEGIMELPNDYIVGTNLKDYIPIDDIIVEIDNKSLTNRPDLWGHYGIAREVAAITNHELIPLPVYEINNDKKDLDIKILSDLCLRYVGLRVENITNNKTPYEFQTFLTYVGMRSISLLVDLTNFVMLETGMPMHAFNANSVQSIEVGLANNQDKFITLDGASRTLNSDTLMIKSNHEYYAIAGIMGGKTSEIEANTNAVILESAVFDAINVRKSATALGLRTEASARFEKSLDPNLCNTVIKRYVQLLSELNPEIKITSNLTDRYQAKLISPTIKLAKTKLGMYLGIVLNDEEVVKILENLEFKVTIKKDHYEVIVPTHRATKDISIAEDLIEEIARIYGYENIEMKPLNVALEVNNEECSYLDGYDVKSFLAIKYKLNEVHTYLWEKTTIINRLNLELDNPKVIGRSEDNILRNNLFGSLLDVVINNAKKVKKQGIFEIGAVIDGNNNGNMLSIMLIDDDKKIKENYYKAKVIINNLFMTFKNIKVEFEKIELSDLFHNQLSTGIFTNNQLIGSIVVVENPIVKKKCIIYIAINFDQFVELEKQIIIYEKPSKYQNVELDYTIIAPSDYKYDDIESIIKNFYHEMVINYKFIDVFENESEKRYTFRYNVGSYERTLTSDDIESFKSSFINFIKDNNLSVME